MRLIERASDNEAKRNLVGIEEPLGSKPAAIKCKKKPSFMDGSL